MDKKYSSLKELLFEDERAKDYFASLPQYVREQANERADSINSIQSLKDYVDNITRMDD